MPRTTSFRVLERQLLDRRIARLRPLLDVEVPRGGWLSAVRHALGMTLDQLAGRLDVTDRAAAQMEKREASGSITLKNLDRAAQALGCRLVYALVPETTLDDHVRDQARRVAEATVDRVEHTMALEAQTVDSDTRQGRIDALASEIIRTGSRELWATHE